jgi:hypothetical protein
VINALFDTDREVLRRLDRIEAKLEVLKNKDATSGWQYLKQALEPHRSDAEKKEQVSFALKAFTDAASTAADEPMNRSAARICQAMCWFCLGSPEDVRNRLGEAAADAYDAVYQAAIQYNEPRNTALATRESWVQRHLPATSGIYPDCIRQPQLLLHVFHICIIGTCAIPGTPIGSICACAAADIMEK